MAQFVVYPSPEGIGYLLDVQTDRIIGLDTRIVVPLLLRSQVERVLVGRLSPSFDLGGEEYLMVTPYLASIPSALLRHPVTDLSAEQDRIKAALDMVFFGI